jgi:hypothetical protein
MSQNIFHLKLRHEFVYDQPCHPVRMTEDTDTSSWVTGLHCTYNAIGHLLKKYDARAFSAVWKIDTGDYYALRILEACWLLISQGKQEYAH